MKLSLGTAQFGMNYGITNRVGIPSYKEVSDIVGLYKEWGGSDIDTAINYGQSESILGSIGMLNMKVISKLPSLHFVEENTMDWVFNHLRGSLMRLGVPKLHAVLVHDSSDLMGERSEVLLRALNDAKALGFVDKIGVSIYSPEVLARIKLWKSLDIVQVPYNLLDRRIDESGWLDKLLSVGIEIHARSIFLQGLLIQQKEKIPTKFKKWAYIWDQLECYANKHQATALECCVAMVINEPRISKAIVGADSMPQLKQILEASKTKKMTEFRLDVPVDKRLINPSLWPEL